MNNNLSEGGVFPQIEKCGIKGKILSSKLKFSKPECFNIHTINVESKNNIIHTFDILEKINLDCSLSYIYGGYGIDISTLPQYSNINKGEDVYFEIIKNPDISLSYQKTLHGVFLPIGMVLESKETPIEEQWNLIIPSIVIGGYTTGKPPDFDSLPECIGYQIGEGITLTGVTQNTSSIPQNEVGGANIFYLASIIGAILLSGVLGGYLYKFFFSKK